MSWPNRLANSENEEKANPGSGPTFGEALLQCRRACGVIARSGLSVAGVATVRELMERTADVRERVSARRSFRRLRR